MGDTVSIFAQGALLLSEVVRERDAQLEYKKKKAEVAKAVDEKYIVLQQEVILSSTGMFYEVLLQEREKGMAADHLAALERAMAQQETARYRAMQ